MNTRTPLLATFCTLSMVLSVLTLTVEQKHSVRDSLPFPEASMALAGEVVSQQLLGEKFFFPAQATAGFVVPPDYRVHVLCPKVGNSAGVPVNITSTLARVYKGDNEMFYYMQLIYEENETKDFRGIWKGKRYASDALRALTGEDSTPITIDGGYYIIVSMPSTTGQELYFKCSQGMVERAATDDLHFAAGECGNNVCEANECESIANAALNHCVGSTTCEDDCILVSAPAPFCGNNLCDSNENPGNCAQDCFLGNDPNPAICNNNICEAGEANINNCPICNGAVCPGEPCTQVPGTCPQDC